MSAIIDMFGFEPAANSTDGDERYTTRETLAWARRMSGVARFDLDAAGCEESHKAEAYFTKETNGLLRPWFGRVWVNPPYSDIPAWVAKAWSEMGSAPGPSVIVMLLPNNRQEQPWWQTEVEPWRDCPGDRPNRPSCPDVTLTTDYPPGRVSFGHPGNPEGVGVGSPPFGCVLLVWRRA